MTTTTMGGSWFKVLCIDLPRVAKRRVLSQQCDLHDRFGARIGMRGPKVPLAPAQIVLLPLRRRPGLPERFRSGMRVNQQVGENRSLNMQNASNNFGPQSGMSLLLPATCISLFAV
jgi:hypothetical protein